MIPNIDRELTCLMRSTSCQSLYEAGVQRKGTDVATWITIMSQRSVPHLQRGEPDLQHFKMAELKGQSSVLHAVFCALSV